MRVAFIVLSALLLLCLLPLILALGAGALSGPLGCDRIAAAFRNCSLFGTDVSNALTNAVTLHWLGLITLPFAALAALAIILLALGRAILYLRQR